MEVEEGGVEEEVVLEEEEEVEVEAEVGQEVEEEALDVGGDGGEGGSGRGEGAGEKNHLVGDKRHSRPQPIVHLDRAARVGGELCLHLEERRLLLHL